MDYLELVISLALLMHGAGMLIAGIGFLLPVGARTVKERSWFLRGWTPYALEAGLGLLLWGGSGVLFLIAGYGHWQGAPWWGALATWGAAVTVAAVALWLGSVPFGAYLGAAFALGVLFWSQFLR